MQTFYCVVAVQPPEASFEFIETYNKLNFNIKELEQSVLLCHRRNLNLEKRSLEQLNKILAWHVGM